MRAKGTKGGYPETTAKCVHNEGRETNSRYGKFLECLLCGQRWRQMEECCGDWIEVGVRPFPGPEAPSATPFKNAHETQHLATKARAGGRVPPPPAELPERYSLSPRPSPAASASRTCPKAPTTRGPTRRREVIDEDLEMEWDVTSINLSD